MADPLIFDCTTTPSSDGAHLPATLSVRPTRLIIAGWTGRDSAAIEHHIEELQALGVPRPSSVPLYYRASRHLLTQDDAIEVLGPDSSGEAEPVLFFAEGQWWLTVGSDHTDRRVETYSVIVSKQMCSKPLARQAWRWADVAARQDELMLRSEIFEDGRWVTYQEGPFRMIRPLMSLVDGLLDGASPTEGLFVSGGTVPARPNAAGIAIRPAARMRLRIDDPASGRGIVGEYRTEVLPIIA